VNKYLDGSWQEFEQWVRFTIGSDFSWRVRPMDKRSNRQMIVDLVQNEMKKNSGVFPSGNAFIKTIK